MGRKLNLLSSYPAVRPAGPPPMTTTVLSGMAGPGRGLAPAAMGEPDVEITQPAVHVVQEMEWDASQREPRPASLEEEEVKLSIPDEQGGQGGQRQHEQL